MDTNKLTPLLLTTIHEKSHMALQSEEHFDTNEPHIETRSGKCYLWKPKPKPAMKIPQTVSQPITSDTINVASEGREKPDGTSEEQVPQLQPTMSENSDQNEKKSDLSEPIQAPNVLQVNNTETETHTVSAHISENFEQQERQTDSSDSESKQTANPPAINTDNSIPPGFTDYYVPFDVSKKLHDSILQAAFYKSHKDPKQIKNWTSWDPLYIAMGMLNGIFDFGIEDFYELQCPPQQEDKQQHQATPQRKRKSTTSTNSPPTKQPRQVTTKKKKTPPTKATQTTSTTPQKRKKTTANTLTATPEKELWEVEAPDVLQGIGTPELLKIPRKQPRLLPNDGRDTFDVYKATREEIMEKIRNANTLEDK